MTTIAAFFLQNEGAGAASLLALGGTFVLLMLAVAVVFIIGFWKVFSKAGQPGWACLIPFYNAYILLKIVGRPGWWLVLFLIPFINFVIAIIVAIDLAKSFGKSAAFGVVMLVLLSGIGYLVLGFGSARYIGPAAAQRAAIATA